MLAGIHCLPYLRALSPRNVHQVGRSSGAADVDGEPSVLPEVASPAVSSVPLMIPHKMAEPPDAGNRKMQSQPGTLRPGKEEEQLKMIDLKVRTRTHTRACAHFCSTLSRDLIRA